MAKKYSIQIILLLTFLLFPTNPAFADGDSDFAFATGLFRKQRWDYAEDAFRSFLKKNPEHERAKIARLYLGLTLSSLEKYDEAHAELRTFIADNPKSRNLADARYRLGESSFYQEKYTQAITELTAYLDSHQTHNLSPWASLMIGESHNALKEHKKAELVLRPLLTSGVPRNITADVTFALGIAMQNQKESDQAVALFERVVAMQSDAFSSRAQARIGTIYFLDGKFDKSSRTYDMLVQKWPDRSIVPAALLQSAIARFRLEEYDAALERLSKVPAESTSATRAAFWTGRCYQRLNRLNEARTAMLKAYEESGDTLIAAGILFKRAELEALDNQKEKAAQMYQDLATRWPASRYTADALTNATNHLMDINDFSAARRTLTRLKALEQNQQPVHSVQLLEARLLIREGKAADAVPLLEAVVSVTELTEPQMLEANFHLIRALHDDAQYVRVLEVFAPLKRLFSSRENTGQHGAIVLAASSALQTQDYATAESLAGDYLDLGTKELHTDSLATRAIAAGHQKKYPEAKADLERLVTEFADDSTTWNAVNITANTAFAHEDFQAAAELYELGLNAKGHPKIHADILIGAARSHIELDAFDRAIALCKQAQADYSGTPDEIRACYLEAFSTNSAGKPKEAQELYLAVFTRLEAVEELDPKLVQYLEVTGRNAALLSAELNDVAGANAIWKRVAEEMKDKPQLEETLFRWALLNLTHSQFDQSDQIFTQLLDRFPNSTHADVARLSLAESLLDAGEMEKSLSEFNEIATTESYAMPQRETAMFHVVEVNSSLRRWQAVVDSCENFEDLFGVSTLRPRVQLLKADAFIGLGKPNEADPLLQLLRDSVLDESIPTEVWTDRIWVVLAQLALGQKDYDKVDEIVTELVQRRPDSVFLFQLRFTEGRRWKARADFQQARQRFQQVLDDAHSAGTRLAAQAQFQIAETFLLQEAYRKAANAYLKVYISHQWDELKAEAMYQAGQCEEQLNQPEAALRNYRTVVDEYPESPDAAAAKKRIMELSKG